MLYDGAIQYVTKAKQAMRRGDKQVVHDNIIAAEKIITEFMSTLDMEIGGDMAKNLYALYDYLYNRLVSANMKNEEVYLDEVLRHLMSLRQTWAQAIQIANKEKSKNTAAKENAKIQAGHLTSEEEDEQDEEVEEGEEEKNEHSYSA